MLSYLHGFHAGNHADVIKHVVLVHLLEHLCRKTKGWRYVDTHAGAGRYDLHDERALKKAEHADGIARLIGRDDLPPAVSRLVELIRGQQPGAGALDVYPGSPLIALALARPQDELHLHELHPREHEALMAHLAADANAHVHRQDGFRGALGLLPPPTRRGLVLVDPSYERKQDYEQVVRFLQQVHRRFATGTVAIWYPLVSRARIDALCAALRAADVPDLLRAELCVRADAEGFGMTGSGMIVFRPAFTLAAALEESLPFLANVLATGPGSAWTVETLVPE
ncbi:MAG: 23S rRNA (adenine(2030)-N(6))-methyltransferase RlmJ [Pseudomonadales bacterium]|jgi:23S rRNA (adenine2030-N6)-methyltransferase|nr:23S rRNA (adenine(2030)-N(6))-methyltransferase RlmJ [Pseudomonadales bacterium]